jgi:hypothetical protein
VGTHIKWVIAQLAQDRYTICTQLQYVANVGSREQSTSTKSFTHYLNDTNRFDVSKGLCSKRQICLYHLGRLSRTFAAF